MVSRRPGTDIYEQVRHFKSVFSSAGDCESLRNSLLAALNAPASLPIPNSETIAQSTATEQP